MEYVTCPNCGKEMTKVYYDSHHTLQCKGKSEADKPRAGEPLKSNPNQKEAKWKRISPAVFLAGQPPDLPEAGIEHIFRRMTIYIPQGYLNCTIEGTFYKIPVIHDMLFWAMPEVSVHIDAKEVYVAEGVMVIESYFKGKADRIVLRAI